MYSLCNSNSTMTHPNLFLVPHAVHRNDAVPSTLGLDLNIAALNIHRENMFLDNPEDFSITVVGDTRYSWAGTFEDMNLSPEVIRALYLNMGYRRPSKIQAITLPMILTPPYKDLVAQAHNGTGKTTCFGLGMLGRVDPNLKAPQALCICPTRELTIQILELLQRMGMYTGIKIECAVPSLTANSTPVRDRAPVTAHIVIGTSGTVHKLMSYKKLGVSRLKVLVFDEADHMLAEDGFRDDSLRIKKEIDKFSPHCQVLLFSATFNEMITKFIPRVMKDHNKLFLKKEELSLEAVKQYKVYCPDELTKIDVIKTKIFELGANIGQRIIFVRSRNSAKMLHEELVGDGYSVTTIHGALSVEDRDKIVKEFKDGLTRVLISTDLLARGFDQQQVNCVVNYDLPIKRGTSEPDYELYLHRCGRAGRFGSKGSVFNLLCLDTDKLVMEKIEHYYNIQVPEVSCSATCQRLSRPPVAKTKEKAQSARSLEPSEELELGSEDMARRTISSSSLFRRWTVHDSSLTEIGGLRRPSSSSSKPEKPEKKRPLDRLSSIIDAVNERKLPPELRGRRNTVRSETDIMNVVEQRIWHSMEEGQFENLPGKGKPLNLSSSNPHADPADDTLYRVLSKNGCAPRWVELNKEIRSQASEWRRALKKAWEERKRDDSKWDQTAEALKVHLKHINNKVMEYNLIVPFGRQMFGLKWEKELDRLELKEC